MKSVLLSILVVFFLTASVVDARGNGSKSEGPVIYVTGQGLYYDSIVLTMLPQKGPFQQLIPTDSGLQTPYGPGDTEYAGGRWWLDANNNGEMDDEDMYFSCPLLGPGRSEP